MKTVTLKAIRAHKPCIESWEKLLASLGKTRADNTEVSLEYILDLLGLDDAMWALRALPESQDNIVRLLLCNLVEPAMKYTNDPRIANAIRVAREYARGAASLDSLEAARYAARYAAWAAAGTRDAGWDAAGAAAWAAAGTAVWAAASDAERAAADAAGATACAAARKDQERIFRDWLRSES